MALWTSGSTFDPALLDIIDWRLGAGQGRLVMMAICSDDLHAHANHRALEALHDCYKTHSWRNASISLELAPGIVWDGADLTLPGTWPETFEAGLAGQPLGKLVDHPALPRDRPIIGVSSGADGIVVHTTRPDPIGVAHLRAHTWTARMRDHLAILVAEGRFTRALGVHEGLSLMTLLSMVLAGIAGFCAWMLLGLLVPLLHHFGLPLEPLVAAWMALSVSGTIALTVAAGVWAYHERALESLGAIFDHSTKRFGRALL